MEPRSGGRRGRDYSVAEFQVTAAVAAPPPPPHTPMTSPQPRLHGVYPRLHANAPCRFSDGSCCGQGCLMICMRATCSGNNRYARGICAGDGFCNPCPFFGRYFQPRLVVTYETSAFTFMPLSSPPSPPHHYHHLAATQLGEESLLAGERREALYSASLQKGAGMKDGADWCGNPRARDNCIYALGDGIGHLPSPFQAHEGRTLRLLQVLGGGDTTLPHHTVALRMCATSQVHLAMSESQAHGVCIHTKHCLQTARHQESAGDQTARRP